MPSVLFLNNTVLTDIYIAGDSFFLRLVDFPGKDLTVHSKKACINTDPNPDCTMEDYCAVLSNETRTIQWEEWDPSALYPEA